MTDVAPSSRWITIGIGILLLIGVVFGLRVVGIDVTQMTPRHVRDFVLSFGLFAPLIYLAVYGQPLVPLPATVMIMTAGLAFGSFWGLLAAITGSVIRACSQFGLARLLGRDAIERLLKGRAAIFSQAIETHAFQAVFLIRLIPSGLPFDVQNYALGLSRVGVGPYVLATTLAIIPISLVYVYLGSSLTDLGKVWKVVVAVALIVAFVLGQRWYVARHQPMSPQSRE